MSRRPETTGATDPGAQMKPTHCSRPGSLGYAVIRPIVPAVVDVILKAIAAIG